MKRPRAGPGSASPCRPNPTSRRRRRLSRVLIVDDGTDLLMACWVGLQALGHLVITVDFLAFLATHSGKVVTRRMIPENVCGPEYAREVLPQGPRVPDPAQA